MYIYTHVENKYYMEDSSSLAQFSSPWGRIQLVEKEDGGVIGQAHGCTMGGQGLVGHMWYLPSDEASGPWQHSPPRVVASNSCKWDEITPATKVIYRLHILR